MFSNLPKKFPKKTTMNPEKQRLTPPEGIGRIDTSGDGRFQWTIDDFLSQVSTDKLRVSPGFKFLDLSYCMRVNLKLNLNQMSLCLLPTCESPARRLHVELRMARGSGGMSHIHCGETDDSGYFATVMWLPKSQRKRNEILTKGRFSLFCNLRSLDGDAAASPVQRLPGTNENTAENKPSKTGTDEDDSISNWKNVKKLQKDLKSLLVSEEECDVVIKVQGKEFPAHRIILLARSPVFKSMFTHNTLEKQSGVVVIDDCDPATFPDFLNYVYTGSTKYICDKNVLSLYTASDKYGVEELKEECAAFMQSNMTIGTFCDTVTLALLHSEKELVDTATVFFCANATEIIKTAKWQIFLSENSTVGNELFIKLLSK